MLSRRLLNISKAPLRRFISNARQIPTTAIGRKRLFLIGLGATVLTVGASITRSGAEASGWFSKDDKKGAAAASSNKEFTLAEVAKHRTAENRIWVTYQNNVYDITEFIEQHPGGSEKIMMAAGSDLAPFWNMYQQHQKAEVKAMLEPFKIGVVAAADRKSVAPQSTADPYKNEPERHPALRVVSAKPFNAETPNAAMGTFIVPNELFFVRNHLPTPVVDGAKYTLEIGGDGVRKVTLSLDELKSRFPKHTVISAIQCAGNRRTEMNKIKQVKGLDWHSGAISNATWGGVRLRDVLVYAGFDPSAEVRHIQFEGLDKDPAGMVYGGSIPLDKALDANGDVLLAYEMNGQELPRDHGYPIRVVAPGIVGARQVKWLSKIVASKNESPSHWQQNDYKGFNPNVDWNNVDFKSAPAIQDLPVQSAIVQPRDGSPLPADADEVTVKGYAYSGGGRAIVRVDVTADGGKNWHTAQLMTPPDYHPQPGRAWAWTPWQATVPIPKDHPEKVELACKAIDSSYNVQPDTVAPIWNLRGVLNNAWHRVSMGQPAQAQAQHAEKEKEKPKTS